MRLEDFTTDLDLAGGGRLPGCRLVTAVWGELNEARDNLILYPTRFGGTHEQNAFLIGPGKALDPERWCIVVPNILGNGVSTSPSTTALGLDFPPVGHADNIALQRAMLAERFGDAPIALAVGWSMGAQQAYRWAVEEPGRVLRLLAICGTARTTPHNRVFLESLLAALEADPRYGSGEAPVAGLRAAGRIYAGWAYSQPWLKRGGYREMGYADLDDWLARYWDALFMARDAGDLTAMWRTWIGNDGADGGDLAAALGRISAQTVVTTAETDLYFTPADCRAEAAMIGSATYRDLETDWGHMAGSGQSAADTDAINEVIAALLSD
ncbi:MAG: alpha/beta fold hydrolase [Pseudomonadota bacterium]